MKKRNALIYWIATLWLSLGMVSTGIVQLIQMEEEVSKITQMGYLRHLLPLLGIWKWLGGVAILVPRFPLVKEWACAGFFFIMAGAIISHVVVEDPLCTLLGPGLLLVLTVISWYFRPANRKLILNP